MNGLSIVTLVWSLLMTQVKCDQTEWQPVVVPRQMQRRHEFLTRLRKENYSSTKSTVRHVTPNSFLHGTNTKYQFGDSKALPGGGSYRYGGHGGAITVSSGYSYSSAGNLKSINPTPGGGFANHYGFIPGGSNTVNGQIQLGYNGGVQGASINSPTLPPKQHQQKDGRTYQPLNNQIGYVNGAQNIAPQRYNNDQNSNVANNNNYNRPAPAYSTNDGHGKPPLPVSIGNGIQPGYANANQQQGGNYRQEPGHPEADVANRNYQNNGPQNNQVRSNFPNGGGGDYEQNANFRGPAEPSRNTHNHANNNQNPNNNGYGGAVNEFKTTNVETNKYMHNPNVAAREGNAGNTNQNGKVKPTIPTTVTPYGSGATYNNYDNGVDNIKNNNNFNTNQVHPKNNQFNPSNNQNHNQVNNQNYNQANNHNYNQANNHNYNQVNNQNHNQVNNQNHNQVNNQNHNQVNNQNHNQVNNQNHNQVKNQNHNQVNNQNYNQVNNQNHNQLPHGQDKAHHSGFNNDKQNHEQQNVRNQFNGGGHGQTYHVNNQNKLNDNFNTLSNNNNNYNSFNTKTTISNNDNNNLNNYGNTQDISNNNKQNGDNVIRPLLKNNDYSDDLDYKNEEFNENDIDIPQLEPLNDDFEIPHPSISPLLPPEEPFPEPFLPHLASTPEPPQPSHNRPPLPPLPPPPPFILNHPTPTVPPMGHHYTETPFHKHTNKPQEQQQDRPHYEPPPTSETPHGPTVDNSPLNHHQDIHHESHPNHQPPTMETPHQPQFVPPNNHPPQPSQPPPTVPPNEPNYYQPPQNDEQSHHHQQQQHPVSKPDQYRQPFDAQPEPPQSLQNHDPSPSPPPSSNNAPNGESGGFYYPPAGPNVNFYHAHLQNSNSINDSAFQKLMNVIYNTLYYGDLGHKTHIKREAINQPTPSDIITASK